MVSKGVELMISGTPIQTKNWRWDINLNWGKNTTRNITLMIRLSVILLNNPNLSEWGK